MGSLAPATVAALHRAHPGRVFVAIAESPQDATRLESDLEETSDKMQFAMSKLQKLLKTKDSCQIWTIVALVIVLLVLVFLAIYM